VEGLTPLHLSVDEGHPKVTHLLIERGADVHATEEYFGETALHIAAHRGYTEIVQALLDAGSVVDGRDRRGRTPLHQSATGDGTLTTAMLLLDKGGDPEAHDEDGESPLTLAGLHSNLAVAHLLLIHGANRDHRTSDGWTAYDVALRQLEHLQSKGKGKVPPKYAVNAQIVRDMLRLLGPRRNGGI